MSDSQTATTPTETPQADVRPAAFAVPPKAPAGTTTTSAGAPRPASLGVYTRPEPAAAVGIADLIAITLTVIWLLGAAIFYLVLGRDAPGTAPSGALRAVMILISVILPVALIWVAAAAARSARVMREESERLHAAIGAMRQSYLQMQQGQSTASSKSVEKKLEEIAAAQRKTEDAIAMFTSIRPSTQPLREKAALPAMAPSEEQGLLALGTPAEALTPPLSVADFIRALNFPETVDDRDGFRALRLALSDRKVSPLIQASQDVLTLLSQDGIYMDDLTPDRSRPEIWRKFAKGERGGTIAPLGGIRDRSSLALAAGRMRQDAIFRDTVHHFLRKFDHTFAEFEQTASDQEISEMTDTRTARAFMLLGRVTGTFD